MALFFPYNVGCRCGHPFEARLAQSVNVGRVPKLRKAILASKMPDAYAAMSPLEFFAELYALYYDPDEKAREHLR